TNKLDDDSNGYIDDWMGWDFVSFDSIEGDNDPHPGNGHGTHVAGICAAVINNGVGIAGVAKKAKYLPVKVAPDEAFNTSVISGYDGIMYAAGMGANVINCSWGSSSKSEAEQEIIDAAVSLGSVVVAAAGNDITDAQFYPSSHSSVLSVTAVDSEDKKAGFSNFHNTIDVSAPGVDIISTIPDNQYSYLSGTSMAAPVASGVAALVCEQYPEYKPIQIIQQIKSTTDNIDTLNPYLNGMLGTGRVNALKALTDSNIKSILVKSYKTEDNNDEIFDRGDTIRLSLSLLNVLRPVKDGWVKLSISDNNFIILKDNSFIGGMASLELRELADTLFFIVPDNIPADSKVMLEFRMFDDTSYCNSEFIEMTFRPTYKTMNANNITVTFNNIGNIGYNDYPNNNQGDGFKYKDSPNLMFEGALMVGTSAERLSNVARGLSQIEQDRSFQSDDIFKVFKNGSVAAQDGYSNFYDLNSVYDAGVSVSQKVYQFDDSISRDFILVVYDIINISGYDTDSLFASLFFDWDIGPSGSYNKAEYDNQQVFILFDTS
ncbi:MAG: S8 family serine peptidase, partial [Bacteroidetes bacterium]|nr:S8 family serine peptidase [Bacteroidota bacterium]